VIFLITPFPVFADHVPTQPPYNQSLSLDSTNGDLTVGIYSSDGFEDSPPEKYTIFFTISDSAIDTSTSFCVSTSFGHGQNLTWQYYTFKLDDLKTFFENPYGTFRTKIRSDNDTDNSYSTLTDELTLTIPNQEPFVGSTDWSAPSSNCVDTSTTTTTSSSTTSSSTTSSSTTSSTTTTTTLPPPPPPTTTTTLAPVIVKIGDQEVEYTQDEVDDGTVDRDIERAENEELYGCYMTNAQIDRGDCDIIFDDNEKDKNEINETVDDLDIVEDEDKSQDLELEDETVLSDEEILEIEKEQEIINDLEDSPISDILGDDDEKIKDFVDTIQEIQENTDFDSLTVDDEIIVVDIPDDLEIKIVEPKEDDVPVEIIEDFDADEIEETKEQEIIEIIEDEVPSLPDEVKNLEDDEIEEAVEEFVETLETETKVEIIEEVIEAGVEELSEDQAVVVQEVVESAIQDVEVLSEEQVESVAEVLGLEESDDVAVIAEAVKTDEAVAEAVESYVERAVENKEVEDYNLSDVVVEIQVEEFLENPAVIFQVDFEEIDLSKLGDDLTNQQKEKAQEVVVPVIIASQIISASVVPFRRIR